MRLAAAALALLLAAAPGPDAHELRNITPIERKPHPRAAEMQRFEVEASGAPAAIEQRRIEYAMRQVVRTWNREYGGAELAFGFPQRDRLIDVLQSRVPRDATLRLVAIEGWRVIQPDAFASGATRAVSITARTRIDFTDASGRRQFREGVNEYHVTLAEPRR
ncbi:MAG TPA: hypothetical protein VM122_00875 [Usitatibacter sp.]|nr:hypothetical protein [Usitatibacter sp.]